MQLFLRLNEYVSAKLLFLIYPILLSFFLTLQTGARGIKLTPSVTDFSQLLNKKYHISRETIERLRQLAAPK